MSQKEYGWRSALATTPLLLLETIEKIMTNLDIYLSYSLGPNDIRFLELLQTLPNYEWKDKQTALAIDLHLHKTTVNEILDVSRRRGLLG